MRADHLTKQEALRALQGIEVRRKGIEVRATATKIKRSGQLMLEAHYYEAGSGVLLATMSTLDMVEYSIFWVPRA